MIHNIQYKNYEFGKQIKLIQELENYKNSSVVLEFLSGTEEMFRWIVIIKEIKKRNEHDKIIDEELIVEAMDPYPFSQTPKELISKLWRYQDFLRRSEERPITIQGFDKVFIPTKEEIKKYGMFTRLRDFVYSNTNGKITS